jgi:hypothetical protein
MPSRMRPPEEVKLELPGGDWLSVKKHLTFGEQRQAETQIIKTLRAGDQAEIDPMEVGVSLALAYLLDWSMLDSAGAPLVIRQQPDSTVRAALFGLDPETGHAIVQAIKTHDDAMRALRESEKKSPAGVLVS